MKHQRIISLTIIFIFFTACISYSETYLCTGQKGAFVVSPKQYETKISLGDYSGFKYIFTNSGGEWVLKNLVNGAIQFDNCEKHGCTPSSKELNGYFSRNIENDTFVMSFLS